MAFFKFRTRGPQANEGRNTSVAAAPAESVETMRRRARHRLVGAAVLVLVGVVGFPLLFDTQPRPVSVDIPIEIPDRNKAKPLALPSTPAPAPAAPAATSASPPAVAAAPSGSGMITESADGSDISQSRPAPAAPPAETRAAAPQPRPETKPEPKPEPKPEAKPVPAKPSASDDGARARALLEGSKPGAAASVVAAKPAAAAEETGRFVVQVGAFADADKARDVRQKLEKAGLKTFTNVAKTADGERTRVRVGPFSTRADADRAASRIKGLSLSASVLSL